MANKKGRSEKKTTFFGREYIQHYDSKGNKSGRSEKKTGFFGNKYTQHYNSGGEKTGRSEKKQTWLGKTYTQKYDARGEKSGRSEKKETWYGKKYTQHYDSDGKKTDWTERKETWYGKPYVQRYGEDTSRTSSSSSGYTASSSSHRATGSSYSSNGSAGYASRGSSSASSSSASSPTRVAALLFGVFLLVGFAVLIGNRNSPTFVRPTPTQPLGNAYINTTKLNVRRGPGVEYPVLARFSKGDFVECIERSQNQKGDFWMHIRNGSRDGWVNEKYLSNSPPEMPTPEPVASATVDSKSEVAAANDVASNEVATNEAETATARPFAVSAVRFFESSENPVPVGERFYSTRFSAAQARYIFWELNLVHANPHDRYDFKIQAVWKRADGTVLGRQDGDTYFESNWTSSYRSLGWGRETPGSWTPGSYTVELYFHNINLATRSFEVY